VRAPAPNDQGQFGFRRIAERYRWAGVGFHRREDRVDRLGALISLASASIAPYPTEPITRARAVGIAGAHPRWRLDDTPKYTEIEESRARSLWRRSAKP
jgi:hypothetical protein